MRERLNFLLYAITGENYHPGRSMLEVMEAAIAGGADIIQLRAKDAPKDEVLEKARALRELTLRHGVPFIVNDYPEIAHAVCADGVHIGQEDLSVAEARALLGPNAIIGVSTHSIEQARAAERSGADYIGVGPVYSTGTKPGRKAVTLSYVREVAAEIRIPWVAIGGIDLQNVDDVLSAGAPSICAVSAIVGSGDPEAAARAFRAKVAAARAKAAIARAAAAKEQPVPSYTLKVNGREVQLAASHVADLVAFYGLAGKRIVAELNGDIIARSAWDRTPLSQGDVVELVHFVGGG
jgi:thiamine-phosphate pyrophosphorylase